MSYIESLTLFSFYQDKIDGPIFIADVSVKRILKRVLYNNEKDRPVPQPFAIQFYYDNNNTY